MENSFQEVKIPTDDHLGSRKSHSLRVDSVNDVVDKQVSGGCPEKLVGQAENNGCSVARMAGRRDLHPQGLPFLGDADLTKCKRVWSRRPYSATPPSP